MDSRFFIKNEQKPPVEPKPVTAEKTNTQTNNPIFPLLPLMYGANREALAQHSQELLRKYSQTFNLMNNPLLFNGNLTVPQAQLLQTQGNPAFPSRQNIEHKEKQPSQSRTPEIAHSSPVTEVKPRSSDLPQVPVMNLSDPDSGQGSSVGNGSPASVDSFDQSGGGNPNPVQQSLEKLYSSIAHQQDHHSLGMRGYSPGFLAHISPSHPMRIQPTPEHKSFSASSPSDSSNSPTDDSPSKSKKRKSTPYIPSYMDLSNGPEPCVVCEDAATGYHYRCMTCEGCKGFFRRTIQKNLKYHCKQNGTCKIDKTTRNQCQYCRFRKCIAVGMAPDLVLNEEKRVAKRRLIEENRERRRIDAQRRMNGGRHFECMAESDKFMIKSIVQAYDDTQFGEMGEKPVTFDNDDAEDFQQHLAEIMTPSIVRVVEFAKNVPGFNSLNIDDQVLLLRCCCMEIMCLRVACRYDHEKGSIVLSNETISREDIEKNDMAKYLLEPIFDFAFGLAKLQLDQTEVALLAAVLLMQSDRTGLVDSDGVESIQDAILGAFKRYVAEKRPQQPVHWAKILMKVTDLRSISSRYAERVFSLKLDQPAQIPSVFLNIFDDRRQSL